MAIISKQKLKKFKLFLVSPRLDKILLITYVIITPLLLFNDKLSQKYSDYFIARNFEFNTVQSSVSSITTLSGLTTWIESTVLPAFFTSTINPNKPVSPVFLFTNQISNTKYCSSLTFRNVEEECSMIDENLQSVSIAGTVTGTYDQYPTANYLAIPYDYSNGTINSEISSLLDSSVSFVSVQCIFYNFVLQSAASIRIVFELDGSNLVQNAFYGYNIAYVQNITDSFYIFLFVLFAITTLLTTVKVLLEFSILQEKYTLLGHLGHNLVRYFYFFYVLISLQNNQKFTIYSSSLQDFQAKDQAIQQNRMAKVIMGFVFIFYPFRLMSLISWNKYLRPILDLLVIIFRTMPVFSMLIVVSAVFVVCFSFAATLGFGMSFTQVTNYGSAILNYFSLDFSYMYLTTYRRFLDTHTYYVEVLWGFSSLFLATLIVFIIVSIVEAVRRSFLHERGEALPDQLELVEMQEELQIKFDKFFKELGTYFESKNKSSSENGLQSREKMVIWLQYIDDKQSTVEEIISDLKDTVRVMIFYSPDEVQSFLRYLFRLKPNLLNSQAGTRFRIVGESSFDKNRAKRRQLIQLLEWLKIVGCRVPFLFYQEGGMEKDIYIELRMRYPAVYASKAKENTLGFCKMEDGLDNLHLSFNEERPIKYTIFEDSMNDISMEITPNN